MEDAIKIFNTMYPYCGLYLWLLFSSQGICQWCPNGTQDEQKSWWYATQDAQYYNPCNLAAIVNGVSQ